MCGGRCKLKNVRILKEGETKFGHMERRFHIRETISGREGLKLTEQKGIIGTKEEEFQTQLLGSKGIHQKDL